MQLLILAVVSLVIPAPPRPPPSLRLGDDDDGWHYNVVDLATMFDTLDSWDRVYRRRQTGGVSMNREDVRHAAAWTPKTGKCQLCLARSYHNSIRAIMQLDHMPPSGLIVRAVACCPDDMQSGTALCRVAKAARMSVDWDSIQQQPRWMIALTAVMDEE